MYHLFLALAGSDLEKYGVFAALVVVASMIVAAVGGLTWLWRGPLQGWEIPEEPMLANRLVTLPSAALMIAAFMLAGPETKWWVLIVGTALTAISVTFGILYAGKRMRFRRFRPVIAGPGTVTNVPVLAGDELTAWARTTMDARQLSEQQCFSGTPHQPYDPEQMWPQASRVRVYQRLMTFFIITLFAGTGALAWLACVVEVQVTGRPASQILHPAQIPTHAPSEPAMR